MANGEHITSHGLTPHILPAVSGVANYITYHMKGDLTSSLDPRTDTKRRFMHVTLVYVEMMSRMRPRPVR